MQKQTNQQTTKPTEKCLQALGISLLFQTRHSCLESQSRHLIPPFLYLILLFCDLYLLLFQFFFLSLIFQLITPSFLFFLSFFPFRFAVLM